MRTPYLTRGFVQHRTGKLHISIQIENCSLWYRFGPSSSTEDPAPVSRMVCIYSCIHHRNLYADLLTRAPQQLCDCNLAVRRHSDHASSQHSYHDFPQSCDTAPNHIVYTLATPQTCCTQHSPARVTPHPSSSTCDHIFIVCCSSSSVIREPEKLRVFACHHETKLL